MEQNKINRLVRLLSKMDTEELSFVKSTIIRHERTDASFKDASAYSKIKAGAIVAFYDKENVRHASGVVNKVNRKWIKVLDTKTKEESRILPEMIIKQLDTKPVDAKQANVKQPATNPAIERRVAVAAH